MMQGSVAAQAGSACVNGANCIVHHQVQSAPLPPQEVGLDGIAVGLTSLATAFTFGTIVFAILGLAGGFGWAWFIRLRAEKIAADTAAQTVDDICNRLANEWFATEAPELIRRHVELIVDTTLGNGNDFSAADEIGDKA